MRSLNAFKNIVLGIFDKIIGIIVYLVVTPYILKFLGKELYGVNQLLVQTVGYFQLAEFGIVTILVVSLYKPIANNDWTAINEIVSYGQRLFLLIAGIILCSGLLFSFFLDNVFHQSAISVFDFRILFIIYIINSSVSYFFSIPVIVLGASQKEYKINRIRIFLNPLISITGVILFNFGYGLIVWALCQLILNVLFSLILYKISIKEFPLLRINPFKKITQVISTKSSVFVFLDKILVLVVFRSDFILLAYFGFTTEIAVYSIYVTFFNFIMSFVFVPITNITHGAGDLLARGKSIDVIRLWEDATTGGFIAAALLLPTIYFNFDSFINVWLETTPLSNNVLILMCINLGYLCIIHPTTMIINSQNKFKERLMGSVLELTLNLIFSIILIPKLGVFGAVIGTAIGHFLGNFWFLPWLLSTRIVHRPFSAYFKQLLPLLLSLAGLFVILIPLEMYAYINAFNKLVNLFANVFITVIVILIYMFILSYRISYLMYFKARLFSIYSSFVK